MIHKDKLNSVILAWAALLWGGTLMIIAPIAVHYLVGELDGLKLAAFALVGGIAVPIIIFMFCRIDWERLESPNPASVYPKAPTPTSAVGD